MKKLLKVTLFLIINIVVVAILLELLLRVAVPSLPDRLKRPAERILAGEEQAINRMEMMQTVGEHNVVMRPDLQNYQYAASKDIVFHVTTNPLLGSSFGFRNRPLDYDPQIAIVGDSFTFCFTEYEDCWVQQLENIAGVGVVNFGQGATGGVSHYNMLKNQAVQIEPPIVLWQFFGNDFDEDYQLRVLEGRIPRIDYLSPREITTQEADIRAQADVPAWVTWLRENSLAFALIELAFFNEAPYVNSFERAFFAESNTIRIRDGILGFGQIYEQVALDMTDPRKIAGYPETKQAYQDGKALVEGWGGELVIILIPVRELAYESLVAPILGEETMAIFHDNHQTMLDLCEELALTCFDALPIFKDHAEQGELLYYTEDMHLNPYGNKVLAEAVFAYLEDNELLQKSQS
ncbi:MAG: SGNH/GDSL hydrolase family protein [bacterium]|nr:SGNH/GDSL hydrolase family protein [bacterium]